MPRGRTRSVGGIGWNVYAISVGGDIRLIVDDVKNASLQVWRLARLHALMCRAFSLARRGRRVLTLGFSVTRLLRNVLLLLARAALHVLLAIAPGALEARVRLLVSDRNRLLHRTAR